MSIGFNKKNQKKRKKFSIASNLRRLREVNRLTVKNLSDALSINFDLFRSYEESNHSPPYKTLIKIAKYFGLTLDFLLIWDKTEYVHNLKFIKLGEKIDKLDKVKRFQLESTVDTLLSKNKDNNITIRFDNFSILLTDNIKKNIFLIRKHQELTQKQIAEKIGVGKVRIYYYENKNPPPVDKIIKLAKCLNASIHSLVTGQKLSFNYNNKDLLNVLLKGDKLLSLEDKQFCIKLMERIILDIEN